MDILSAIAGFLLLAPPAVIAAFWWLSVRRGGSRSNALPDSEAMILARLGGLVCSLLPLIQLFAGIVRYRTGAFGHYLWFVIPGCGLLLALFAVVAFLSHARGPERSVSSAMVLLSFCTLLLLTLQGTGT